MAEGEPPSSVMPNAPAGTILGQEVARGVVDYHSTSRRYVLNGALPDDVKAALRDRTL